MMAADAAGDRLSRSVQFLWGLAGSVFPPLIHAYDTVKPDSEFPHLGAAFIVVGLLFLMSGGLWSMAMGSEKPWKAIYNGATFPLVFGYLAHAALPAAH